MKKGFTMIELLAVFTITAIILLVSVPFITNMIKQGSNNSKENFLSDVYIATEAYIQDDKIIVTNEFTYITIKDLLESGYLKSNLVNPDNNKKVSSKENVNKKIKVYKDEEGVLQYEMEELK